MQILGPFLLIRFGTDSEQNFTNLGEASSFTVRDLLKAPFEVTRNSEGKRSSFFHDIAIV
jgi:hypothetical protein